jgi:hypothetical protein
LDLDAQGLEFVLEAQGLAFLEAQGLASVSVVLSFVCAAQGLAHPTINPKLNTEAAARVLK